MLGYDHAPICKLFKTIVVWNNIYPNLKMLLFCIRLVL